VGKEDLSAPVAALVAAVVLVVAAAAAVDWNLPATAMIRGEVLLLVERRVTVDSSILIMLYYGKKQLKNNSLT